VKKWEVLPDSCSDVHLQMLSPPHLIPQRTCSSWVLLQRTNKNKREEAEESISLLEDGFLPALPVAVREEER
jgi:hypothetical protein